MHCQPSWLHLHVLSSSDSLLDFEVIPADGDNLNATWRVPEGAPEFSYYHMHFANIETSQYIMIRGPFGHLAVTLYIIYIIMHALAVYHSIIMAALAYIFVSQIVFWTLKWYQQMMTISMQLGGRRKEHPNSATSMCTLPTLKQAIIIVQGPYGQITVILTGQATCFPMFLVNCGSFAIIITIMAIATITMQQVRSPFSSA